MRYRVSVTGWGSALTSAHLTLDEVEQRIARSLELNPKSTRAEFEITEVDEPSRPCKYCQGEIVNDSHPECDFCRDCYYNGNAMSEAHADALKIVGDAFGAENVSPWHTGGGSWAVGVVLPNGWSILIGNEGSIPDDPDAEEWGAWVDTSTEENGWSSDNGFEWPPSRFYARKGDGTEIFCGDDYARARAIAEEHGTNGDGSPEAPHGIGVRQHEYTLPEVVKALQEKLAEVSSQT